MNTTRHILNHRSGMLELVLDETSGEYHLRYVSVTCADEDFIRDLRRWVRQIGHGWQKRNGHQTVPLNFSTELRQGKFKPEGKQL
jgi:hypothetical protein